MGTDQALRHSNDPLTNPRVFIEEGEAFFDDVRLSSAEFREPVEVSFHFILMDVGSR